MTGVPFADDAAFFKCITRSLSFDLSPFLFADIDGSGNNSCAINATCRNATGSSTCTLNLVFETSGSLCHGDYAYYII